MTTSDKRAIDKIPLGSWVELREGDGVSLGRFMIAEASDEGVRYNGGRVLVSPVGRVYSAIDLGREVVDGRTESELVAAQLGAAAYDHLHGVDGITVQPHSGRGGLAFTVTGKSTAPWVLADCAIQARATRDMSLLDLEREVRTLAARVGIEFTDAETPRGPMRMLVAALRKLDASAEE